MDKLKFKQQLLSSTSVDNVLFKKLLFGKEEIEVYPNSIKEIDSVIFFIAREHKIKYLFLYCENTPNDTYSKFEGVIIVPAEQKDYQFKDAHLTLPIERLCKIYSLLPMQLQLD